MGLGGIGWFLPLDKNFPEMGIGVRPGRDPHLENREMWGTRRGRLSLREARSMAGDKSVRSTRRSVEFQGDELGWLVAYIGQGVGVAAGEPLHVAGLENAWHGALAYDIAAHLQVGYRDQQVRARMVMAGHSGARLQLGFGDAHAVLNEDDVLRASGEDVEAAFFVPLRRRRLAGGFVLQKFDSHVAERGVGQIAGDVGEVAGDKTGFTILQVKRDGRLALDVVLGLRGAERDEDVIVVMGVHESRVMGWDLHLEHADVFVFEGEVVMGLGGEFDLGSILRGQSDGCE